MRRSVSSAGLRQLARRLTLSGVIATLVMIAFVACSDKVTAPNRAEPPIALAYTECRVYTLQGQYGSILDDDDEWWVQDAYYDEYNDETVITLCRYVEDEPDDPPGDPGGGSYCSSTPWAPECNPPPPPPPCNPFCGGDPPGDGGGNPDAISVSISIDSSTVGFGSTVRATATVNANNGGTYTPDGWSWSGAPGTSCGSDLVCEMQVTGSGWLFFAAHKNAVSAIDSVEITVNPLAVSIVCERLQGAGPPIVRGESVDCFVSDTSALAGWTVTYNTWRFTPGANQFGALGVVTETNGESHFGGRVAIGGSVELALRMQKTGIDTTVTVTTTFEVNARDAVAFPARSADQMQDPPPYNVTDAYPSPARDTIGATSHDIVGSVQAQDITAGPNKGYRYLVGYNSVRYAHGITIPYSQFQQGGYYFNLAFAAPQGVCTQAFVRDMLYGKVREHEGVNRESNSHTGAGRSYLLANITAIRDRAESVVYPSTTAGSAVAAFIVDKDTYDAAVEVPDNVPANVRYGCHLRTQ